MKKYKVFATFIDDTWYIPMANKLTCYKEFDSIKEAIACLDIIHKRFPESYISNDGKLVRDFTYTKRDNYPYMFFDITYHGRVIWEIIEEINGKQKPIRINNFKLIN